MSKEEFLRNLQESLAGAVPVQTIRENLRYYDDYLTAEMAKGRTVDDIVAEIGDAKLIARSIIDATPGSGEGAYETADYTDSSAGTGGGPNQSKSSYGSGNIHYYNLNKWYYKLLAVVLVVVIVTVVLTVVGGILSLVIPLLPVIGLVILIMWFVRGFR